MKCRNCQAENPDTEEVCNQCGAKLERFCPECGTSNHPSYRFCGECGHALIIVPEPVPSVALQPPVVAVAKEPVPTAEEEIKAYLRISTGVEGLDRLIGGGLLANKVYLVSGESGTGKTIFGLQYIYYGLIVGENGIIISGDGKPSHLVADAESLGWDLGRYVTEQKLGLLDISSYFAELRIGKKENVDVYTVVADIAAHASRTGAKRILIDPIAPLVFGAQYLPAIQEYVRGLTLAIEDNLECTTVVTSGITSGNSSLSPYGIAELISSGVIVLGTAICDGQRVRTLFIRKMRSSATDLNDHIFDILPTRGMVLRD